MQGFDAVLRDLVRRKLVDAEEAHANALDPTKFEGGQSLRDAA
jgi:hypothetical protein